MTVAQKERALTSRPAVEVSRSFSSKRLNELANHPDIRPTIDDPDKGVLDLSPQIASMDNVFVVGEHGGCLLLKLTPSLYEAHTMVRPEGRGPWALSMVKAVERWMFCNTDACEILTRVPHGHQAARTLSVAAGMSFEFTRPDGGKFKGVMTPVDIYGITIQTWLQKDAGLAEQGREIHDSMRRQADKLGIKDQPHEDDEDHNRVVGACFEMLVGGQTHKAVAIYNRWAQVSRHKPIELLLLDPPTIRMDVGIMRLVSGKLEMLKC